MPKLKNVSGTPVNNTTPHVDLPANGTTTRAETPPPVLSRAHRESGNEESVSIVFPLQDTRTVFIGGRIPSDHDVIIPQKFPDNRVITSKYTIINFIPKNLFEQFRRVANMYFLWVAIIQLAIDSPVSPITTTMPLAFVVTVTAIKQGYEDWLRHKADNEVNCRETTILKDGKLNKVRAKDIKVGDIVLVRREESFPCDLVLLSSTDKDGKCHVTTANLDGETNLKVRKSVSQTKSFESVRRLSSLVGVIECQQPNPDLYSFKGRITAYKQNGQKDVRSLSIESVLLKGARLKNTTQIFGCAVFTGQETKMSLNSRVKSNKFSTIERSMNTFLLIFLGILVLEVVLCTGIRYHYLNVSETWYISSWAHISVKDFFQTALSFLVLFNYIIPISLYVTIEMQKFIGSLFLVWDEELYDAQSNQCAKCNSSDLNEELGQVEFLFTDKTGTLTENDMRFRQCSIAGVRYQEFGNVLCYVPEISHLKPVPVKHFTEEIELFLLVLAICHTVQISSQVSSGRSGFEPEFQASSPDEKALVEACYRFGVRFKGLNNDIYTIDFRGTLKIYKCLHILEFTPERRCMSVIVKDEDGIIYVLCKGAEVSLFKKCATGARDATAQHVNDYAMIGLRTLVLAYKKLTVHDFEIIDATLKEARNAIHDREQKMRKACQKVEHSLHLLGAVGVEDRLQDGVSETLVSLGVAGIKVWILTGDKMETAVNISYSCGHFKRCMVKLTLVEQRGIGQCKGALEELRSKILNEPMNSYGLVVDGSSIKYALSTECMELMVEVSCRCDAVVCCRMSPIQKAEIVKAIKSCPPKPITAAIGDGANDCSMIQEAHVGIGLMGKEGRQAMRCSDFAISRFRFLRRMFLVHGHYYYVRVSTLVQYFFYKNVAFITPQVYFAFFNAFSTQTLYDGVFMSFFNIFFTSLPIFIFGLFEQNIKQETLLSCPELYRDNTRNARLSAKEFIIWNSLGLWHSLVFFFGCYFLMESVSIHPSGQMFGYNFFGTLIFHLAVVVINLKLFVESHYLTLLFVGSIILSITVGFMMFTVVYSAINWSSLISNYQMYWVYIRLLATPSTWLLLLAVTILALIPDVVIHVIRKHYSGLKNYFRSVFVAEYRQRPHVFFIFTKRTGNLTVSQINILEQ